jgi:hypothetical protein
MVQKSILIDLKIYAETNAAVICVIAAQITAVEKLFFEVDRIILSIVAMSPKKDGQLFRRRINSCMNAFRSIKNLRSALLSV